MQLGNIRNRNEVKYETAKDAVLVEGRKFWLDHVDKERRLNHQERMAKTGTGM